MHKLLAPYLRLDMYDHITASFSHPLVPDDPLCANATTASESCVGNETSKIKGDDSEYIVDHFENFLSQRNQTQDDVCIPPSCCSDCISPSFSFSSLYFFSVAVHLSHARASGRSLRCCGCTPTTCSTSACRSTTMHTTTATASPQATTLAPSRVCATCARATVSLFYVDADVLRHGTQADGCAGWAST